MVDKKRPPEESRTFETRVKFIDEIFSNLYTRDQIMASCITYKLDKSFDAYIKEKKNNQAWQSFPGQIRALYLMANYLVHLFISHNSLHT